MGDITIGVIAKMILLVHLVYKAHRACHHWCGPGSPSEIVGIVTHAVSVLPVAINTVCGIDCIEWSGYVRLDPAVGSGPLAWR